MLLNQTVSSPGEDYLYYMLRTPEFGEDKLVERERLYSFFREHEKERRKVQEILAHIRKPPTASVYQAIHVTKEYDAGKTWKQIPVSGFAVHWCSLPFRDTAFLCFCL